MLTPCQHRPAVQARHGWQHRAHIVSHRGFSRAPVDVSVPPMPLPTRNPSRRNTCRTVLCTASVVLFAAGSTRPARASFFDVFGFSARAIARAGSLVALGHDYDAAYYNPANILSRKRVHLGFGFDLVAPATDVQQVGGPFDVRHPATNLGFHLGMSTPIGGIFDDRIGFGLAFFHPLTTGTSVTASDPSTIYFQRHQDLPDKLILAAALAAEPFDWLRVGLGVQILAELDGRVNAALSLAEGRFNRELIDVELVPTLAPTAGLALGPFEGVRIGATYRHALSLAYRLPVVVAIEEVGDLTVEVDGVSLYTPSQLALGVGWDSGPVDAPGVSVEAGLTLEFWRGAPPAGASFRLRVDDSAIRPPSPGDPQDTPEFILDNRSDAIPLGERDTMTLRLGGEWRVDGTWALRAGYAFRPTHLPRPIYLANVADTDIHVASLGGGVTFGDPTGDSASPIHLDFSAQLTALGRRSVLKAPVEGNVQGAWEASGLIWAFSLDLRHDHF
jgi:hypothetical protein